MRNTLQYCFDNHLIASSSHFSTIPPHIKYFSSSRMFLMFGDIKITQYFPLLSVMSYRGGILRCISLTQGKIFSKHNYFLLTFLSFTRSALKSEKNSNTHEKNNFCFILRSHETLSSVICLPFSSESFRFKTRRHKIELVVRWWGLKKI